MAAKEKHYTRNYVFLALLQAMCILLCLGSTLHQIIAAANSGAEVSQGYYVSYLLNLLICFWVIIYAVWGYNNSIVPYRLALTTYIIAAVIKMDRLVTGGLTEEWMLPTAILLGSAVAFTVIFDNSFKKHKKAAIFFGVLMMLTELARGILYVVYAVHDGMTTDMISAEQPFAAFLTISALVITYIARCHWSYGGKVSLFEEDNA